ncbi:MAG: hypothetical protein J5J00_03885 [Deltaproteobacteria bacterium]|nr:hypothetical protein [Deltaproteobacteria bacterium]
MKHLIIIFAAAALMLPFSPQLANSQQSICVNNSGKLVVRRKCKKGESKLNRNSLKGDRGDQGLPGRGVNEALTSGTSIRGAAAGVFAAPGDPSNPWSVSESFKFVLPEPITSDKIIVAQKPLRNFCRAAANAGIIPDFLPDGTTKDCLRTTTPLGTIPLTTTNQFEKQGQFDGTNEDNVCTGTAEEPTAPAGYVCIYLTDAVDFHQVYADTVPTGSSDAGFSVNWVSRSFDASKIKTRMGFTWAYTAP